MKPNIDLEVAYGNKLMCSPDHVYRNRIKCNHITSDCKIVLSTLKSDFILIFSFESFIIMMF